MILQSNVDIRLLNGLLLVTPVFLSLFPICNFALINIFLDTVPLSAFGRHLSRLSRGLLLNTRLTFVLPSTVLTTAFRLKTSLYPTLR